MSTKAQSEKFQKGERVISSATDMALKYYPAVDEQVLKKGCTECGLEHSVVFVYSSGNGLRILLY
jgi:hypothetical protein